MFLTMAVSVVIIAVLIITIYVNRNRLLLEKKEQELRSKNEILEIKNIERMKLESMTEDVLARLSQLKASVKDRDTRDRISGISRDIENTTKDQNFTDGEWSRLVPVFNSEPYKKLIKEFPDLTDQHQYVHKRDFRYHPTERSQHQHGKEPPEKKVRADQPPGLHTRIFAEIQQSLILQVILKVY